MGTQLNTTKLTYTATPLLEDGTSDLLTSPVHLIAGEHTVLVAILKSTHFTSTRELALTHGRRLPSRQICKGQERYGCLIVGY
jgi:hypothetical protein